MRKHLFIALALSIAAAAPAAAQPEPTAGEVEAVRELLQVSRTRDNFIRAMELGMEQGGGTELTPELRQVVRDFMDEYFSYEELEPDFIRMYTDLFTEGEIRELTAFYRTPIGQRLADLTPEMSAATQQIVSDRLLERMPELMQRIMEAMEEEKEQGGVKSD